VALGIPRDDGERVASGRRRADGHVEAVADVRVAVAVAQRRADAVVAEQCAERERHALLHLAVRL
jgi:hypothetical protein